MEYRAMTQFYELIAAIGWRSGFVRLRPFGVCAGKAAISPPGRCFIKEAKWQPMDARYGENKRRLMNETIKYKYETRTNY